MAFSAGPVAAGTSLVAANGALPTGAAGTSGEGAVTGLAAFWTKFVAPALDADVFRVAVTGLVAGADAPVAGIPPIRFDPRDGAAGGCV